MRKACVLFGEVLQIAHRRGTSTIAEGGFDPRGPTGEPLEQEVAASLPRTQVRPMTARIARTPCLASLSRSSWSASRNPTEATWRYPPGGPTGPGPRSVPVAPRALRRAAAGLRATRAALPSDGPCQKGQVGLISSKARLYVLAFNAENLK